MEDGLATGYSSRVEIEFHNSSLERYASLDIPPNVPDSWSMLVDTLFEESLYNGS
jgi:hypothetical protein